MAANDDLSEKGVSDDADICENLTETEQVERLIEKDETCETDSVEDDVFGNAEPWDPIETKMVIWSFGAAVFFLVIFGYLINRFLLS